MQNKHFKIQFDDKNSEKIALHRAHQEARREKEVCNHFEKALRNANIYCAIFNMFMFMFIYNT